MSLLPPLPLHPFDDINKLVSSNLAFTNPYQYTIDFVTMKINNMVSYVNFASIITNPLYNPDVATNALGILTASTSILTTLNRFGIHTDNLSGVSLSSGLTGANFATISTVVSTVQKNSRDGSICEIVNGVFGAIQNIASILNKINILISDIENIINIPFQIASKLNTIIAFLENQIQTDLLNFANAQLTALQLAASAALSSLLHNQCIADIISKVGTDELKKVVNSRIRGII